MCRILYARADSEFSIAEMLRPFAELSRASREFQGHGWGCAWREGDHWRQYHDIRPIWEDDLEQFGGSNLLLVHARSAFRDEGIVVENNMPFSDGESMFIFNGELRGVRIKSHPLFGTQCVNCPGSWYSTSLGYKKTPSQSSVGGKGSSRTGVLVPLQTRPMLVRGTEDGPSSSSPAAPPLALLSMGPPEQSARRFDVGIPFACEWKRLAQFLDRFPALPRSLVDARFIITNYKCRAGAGKSSAKLQQEISRRLRMPTAKVSVVDVPGHFARAVACNHLHAKARRDSVLLVIDVDMELRYDFFVHAEMFARKGVSVYFPIVWSKYSPASIKLVEKFRGKRVSALSSYDGLWRPFGFGNYAIHGADAHEFRMDESISGWGGEDNDFHKRCVERRHIIRMHDPDLAHIWHGKDCTRIDAKRRQSCVGSLASVEGSSLALYLQMHKIKQQCDNAEK